MKLETDNKTSEELWVELLEPNAREQRENERRVQEATAWLLEVLYEPIKHSATNAGKGRN